MRAWATAKSVIEEASGPSFTVRVPSQPWASRTVRELVIAFAERFGAGAEDLAILATALGEAVANAIEHSGTSEPIEVTCCASDERIIATVRDFGTGINPATASREIPAAHCERGRGMPIMRSCSDFFSIESEPGAGTSVVVGRYLRRTPGAAPRTGTGG